MDLILKIKILNAVIWNPMKFDRLQEEGKTVVINHQDKQYQVLESFTTTNVRKLNMIRLLVSGIVLVLLNVFYFSSTNAGIGNFLFGLALCFILYFFLSIVISLFIFGNDLPQYVKELRKK